MIKRENLEVNSINEVKGWFCDEYVGISIINLWSMSTTAQVKKYRRRNRWTRWLGFEWGPVERKKGQIVFKLRWFNPFKRYLKSKKIKKIMKEQ